MLTGDQDWAPEWALEAMLDLVAEERVPYHLFVTNPSPAVRRAAPPPQGLTLGIHPNFLAGSTQGGSEDEVIDHCLGLVPGATTFRTHAFCESSRILRRLAARGLRADSNLLSFLQPGLVPVVLGAAGILRFPVFLEDDVLLDWAAPDLALEPLLALLLTPGLKILNFHPTFVALNAPSLAYYEERREALFASPRPQPEEPFAGRGVQSVLREIVRAVRAAGHEFTPFPDLVAGAQLDAPAPYGWPGLGGSA